MPKRSTVAAALLAAAATCLFWLEYLPPFQRVHLYSDIEGYHWPILVAALDAIRNGRFPLWDPSIYCGIPFAGNIQAALFYPPLWPLLLLNLRSRHLLFQSLEAWVFLHAWLAFLLCWLWLRGRRFHPLACALGSAVFAFGGYMASQNSHIGAVTGYAWTPLAWLAIDQAFESRSTRPLWKLVGAAALCFLAGYPSSYVAFAAAAMAYAAARSWRLGLRAAAAVLASLAVAAVQILPFLEAAALKTFDPKYGYGMRDPVYYLHLLVPDWVGFRTGDPYPYLYLGVPALFGLPWLLRRPDRGVAAVLTLCALVVLNPGSLLSWAVAKSTTLVQLVSTVSFLEPATLAFAYIAARGADAFLRGGRPASRGFAVAASAALAAWSAYRLFVWPAPVAGWRSVAETAVMLALFAAGLCAARQGRTWAAVVLCAAVLADYKVAGTSRPFSSMPGDPDTGYRRGYFAGVDRQAYDVLRQNRHYRIAVDGMHPTDLRRYGLATPQGFDPLLSRRYKQVIERSRPFDTNRLFQLSPGDRDLLQLLGVRYFITRDGASFPVEVARHPDFRLVGGSDTMSRVYEYVHAKPPWRLEGTGRAEPVRWEPERRWFHVDLPGPARFVLIEQFYPGWKASLDGRPLAVEEWGGAFQSVALPPGAYTLAFEYRPAALRYGAAISLVSLALLAVWAWRDKRAHER